MKGIIEKLGVSPESSCYSQFMVEKYNSQGEPDIDYVTWLEDGWKDLIEAMIILMDGVNNLPPLIVIQGALAKQWERAEESLRRNINSTWTEIKAILDGSPKEGE